MVIFLCFFMNSCLIFIFNVVDGSVLRPRGVSLSMKVFYDPSKNFTCLDGSHIIPFYFVNDDYCDCIDGSDEPGTSACPNGIFTCNNCGYIEESIPSTKVNDNVCDCCDVSDEYETSTDCVNICKNLGQQAKETEKRQREVLKEGYRIRLDYVYQGQRDKFEVKKKMDDLKQKRIELQQIKKEKEATCKELEMNENMLFKTYKEQQSALEKRRQAERQELADQQKQDEASAITAFKRLDKNRNKILTIQELKFFPEFDYDHDGVVSEKEAKFFLQMKDEITLEDFVQNSWKVMKLSYNTDKESASIPAENKVQDAKINKGLLFSSKLQKKNAKTSDENASVKKKKAKETIDDKTLKQASKATHKAKQELSEIERILENIRKELRELQEILKVDYGLEDEFFILKGQCFNLTHKEYIYRLCPFQSVIQLPLSGDMNSVLLGNGGRWIGLESNRYSRIKFDKGDECWDGVRRSAEISQICGNEDKLLSVMEPSPCEYYLEFSSPAMCSEHPGKLYEGFDEIILDL